MNRGDLVELKIEKYAFEGKGIAKIKLNDDSPEDFVVFAQHSYPGDIIEARINKVKKSFAEASIEKIISPSPHRVDPKCKYFGTCGGCKQQDLDYQQQQKFKQEQVEEIFNHAGGLNEYSVETIIPSEKIFYYRNKMEFSFSDLRWLTKNDVGNYSRATDDFVLGLHVPNVYDKILDIDECFLQSELSNKILNFTRDFFKRKGISIYSTKTHTGYLRNLVIRQSQHTNDLMVNLVTASANETLMKEYSTALLNEMPQITTIVNNVNLKKASVALGDFENVYHGSGYIYDYIGKYKFRISSNSFFQTNTLQAEKLYQTALDFAELNGNEIVYDLYSGAGTIAIYISEKAKEVYGFESFEPSTFDAKENAGLNNITNVKFILADLYKTFLPLTSSLPKPDVVILDPPRSGMHKNTVADIMQLNPKKIVYVSCNPATQVRDIKMMVESGYKLIKIRPVDMFPHTFHIENVGLLINGTQI